jgi:signal transduction histidine kinase
VRSEGKFVIGVLIASVAVATMLAFKAISAARSRQAVSDAMLRQYAQLAAWDYARESRKDIDASLSHTLTSYVHSMRHDGDNKCNCAPVTDVESWFEVDANGGIVERAGQLSATIRAAVAKQLANRGAMMMETPAAIRGLPEARVLALRSEPHARAGGGVIGMVVTIDALEAVLAHTFRRATLLPPQLLDGRDARGLVDLQVHGAEGRPLFVSPGTTSASPVADAAIYDGGDLPLRVRASMTPAFVSTLGPEHGAGPNATLVIGLVIVNALMVTVGLWQLRRERELAKLREDFVAGVSHELRTPLAQIRMFTDTLLLDRIRNPVEGRRAIEIIGQETRRLSQLVEKVLYFHRHRRTPAASPGAPMDLSTFLLEVTEGFRPLAASKRVRLAINTPVREVIVIASADALRQVLLNLLDNAVKFGPPDEAVVVSLETSGAMARLSVEDRGRGVPAADRRRIFEPFERGDARGSGGAGIGLAVVRRIVTDHGGTVTIEDTATGGARFVVSLPLAAEEPQEPAALAG